MAETVVPRKFEIEKPIEDTPQGKDKRAQSWDFGLGHELMRNDPGAIVAGNAPTGEAPFDPDVAVSKGGFSGASPGRTS